MDEIIAYLELMLKSRKEHCEIIKLAGGYCCTCDKDVEMLDKTINILKQLEVN